VLNLCIGDTIEGYKMSTTRDRFSKLVWWQLVEGYCARWHMIASGVALLVFIWAVASLIYSMVNGAPTEYQGETLAIIIATALGLSAFVAKLGRGMAEVQQILATNKPAKVSATTAPFLMICAVIAAVAAWGTPWVMALFGASPLMIYLCVGLLVIVLLSSLMLAAYAFRAQG
jgi:hypothetical protein